MKKILLILLVAVFTLTTVLISACGNNEDTGGAESSSSIEEVVSSSVRPSRGSVNPELVSSSTVSYEDPNGSMSYTDPNIVSGSNAGGVYVEGDPFTVTSADPTGASINASTVIGYINMIGTVDGYNYEQKGQYIQYARQKYDALTAGEKAEVINYASLQGAELAYNNFAETASLQNVELFKQKVTEIANFEHTSAYKAKLDEADEIYEKIIASLKGQVSSEKSTLDSKKALYADHTVVKEFVELYNAIAQVTSVDASNKSASQQASNKYIALTASQKNIISEYADANTVSSKMSFISTELDSKFPTYLWAEQLGQKKLYQLSASGTYTETSAMTVNHSGSTSSGSVSVSISGVSGITTLGKARKLSSSNKVTCNLPYGGKLILYVGQYNNNAATITVSAGGASAGSQACPTAGTLEFDVPQGGALSIVTDGKECLMFAFTFC